MKRTPQEIYDYESKRIDEYEAKLMALLEELKLNPDVQDRIISLWNWNGHARAIKSKAYQDMKKTEFDEEHESSIMFGVDNNQ
jgi:hypothetical protein